ncbi:oxidoreductase [Paenibacillus swuensis]|uniref:Oxidoreductase n=1 Tax=Paenibacillus swuensis TaxID=1178515 RepID=A0A172TMB6_9BACL|nr:Gfo/Idh/MocA family oxidoreductase [Paenibacillus swuensis]ANE48205.1 oxidoreductase [Paenibacillus swuensis]
MSMKVGLAGTGWFGKVHAEILSKMDGVSVAAVCGTSAAKAEAFAAQFSGMRTYDSFLDMLDAEKLDAVYLCVPPYAHGDMESLLIERGIPFLVEKPLHTGIETPRSIVEQLKLRPVITSVGYHLRYRETVKQMRESIEQSGLGMVTGAWMGSFVNNAWWPKQELSGGQFVEQTTHLVDLMRYVAGEATEVYASFAQREMHRKYDDVSVADVGTVTLKLASGAIANLSNTCILPDGMFDTGLKFYTADGVLDWTMSELKTITSGNDVQVSKDEANPYELENEIFIHAVRTGDPSGICSSYEDALRSQEITVAATESARTGKPIQI